MEITQLQHVSVIVQVDHLQTRILDIVFKFVQKAGLEILINVWQVVKLMEHQHQISVKCVDMFVLTSRIAKTILVYNNAQFYILMTKQVHVKLFAQILQSNSLLIQLIMIAIQIVKLVMSEIMIQVIVFNRI